MPEFSEKSSENLNSCHADLVTLFNHVIMYYDCSVLEGHRSHLRQLELYDRGLTKVRVGQHNYFPSRAVDVAPYPIDWDDMDRFYHFGGFVMGVASVLGIDVRWGGDWDGDLVFRDQGFNDLVHFELTGPGELS